ncbi:MAG: hypothetical protein DWQ31_13590 [Planctomycetota bacterium]|nr:MAG: hypothetical protein DWQ31_13590 [Planctomycetota bacterium]REJ90295.1 MAG: hypothetical protein DWQ35_16580 [Planctomycetota bacterium]
MIRPNWQLDHQAFTAAPRDRGIVSILQPRRPECAGPRSVFRRQNPPWGEFFSGKTVAVVKYLRHKWRSVNELFGGFGFAWVGPT